MICKATDITDLSAEGFSEVNGTEYTRGSYTFGDVDTAEIFGISFHGIYEGQIIVKDM